MVPQDQQLLEAAEADAMAVDRDPEPSAIQHYWRIASKKDRAFIVAWLEAMLCTKT